jgi:hypothetical protein
MLGVRRKKGHPENLKMPVTIHFHLWELSLYSPGGFCCSRFFRSSSCFFSSGVRGR